MISWTGWYIGHVQSLGVAFWIRGTSSPGGAPLVPPHIQDSLWGLGFPIMTVLTLTTGTPLRQAMISYSWRILGLSIVISLVTATLIFGALQWLLIRPMRKSQLAVLMITLAVLGISASGPIMAATAAPAPAAVDGNARPLEFRHVGFGYNLEPAGFG